MSANNRLTPLFKLSQIFLLTTLVSTTAHAKTHASPIVIDDTYIATNGSTISGSFAGSATQAPITINTSQPVTISNAVLTGPGDMIQALTVPANITVTNTTATGINPNVRGVQKGIFLHVNSFTNINMQNNTINGLRLGFYNSSYAGDHTAANSLIIDKNLFNNIDARPSDGKGSYLTTGQYNGQAIHLGNINGVAGIDIGWNQIMNTAFSSSTGALIEINESSGTSSSNMNIHNNFISGAFPTSPGTDLYGFGGILVNGTPSDTATNASSFISINNNTVTSTANYGIAIVAGHDVNVTTNRVVSSGYLPDGKTFYPMSTYGNAAGGVNVNLFNQASSIFFNNSVTNNVLGLIKNNGSNAPVRNDWNLPGQGNQTEGNTQYSPVDSTDPTVASEATELATFNQNVLANGITIGNNTDIGYIPDSTPVVPTSPISTTTSGNLVIDHVSITNPSGDCINVNGSGTAVVTITNSVIGPCAGRGIVVTSAASANVQNNYVHDAPQQGILFQSIASTSASHNTIENAGTGIYLSTLADTVNKAAVDFNKIVNVLGMNGHQATAIQFDHVNGADNSLSCNDFIQPDKQGLRVSKDSFSVLSNKRNSVKLVGNSINGVEVGGHDVLNSCVELLHQEKA